MRVSLTSISLCLWSFGMQSPAAAESATLLPVEVTAPRETAGSTLGLDLPGTTGSRLGLTARETPASVSSLGAADIAERSLTRAQDVAVRMPGITEAPAPGNGGTSLVARGFAGHSSVAQMVDGTRLIVASGTITYPFSTWPMESVEVLRGPASVLYGDGAIGAAVNYVTKRPAFGTPQREAFLSVGSFGSVQGGVGLRGPINDVLAYSVYLDAEKSDGYRQFMDTQRHNYALALAVRASPDLNVTLSLDGGVNDDARYFGTPLRNGVLDERLRRTNFNVADSVVQYDDRIWRAKVDWQAAAGVRLRNETYHLTTDRHWRNAEAYAFNAAGTAVNRSDYLEILHDQQQAGNRLDAAFDGHLGGMKNRFIVGLDWYRTRLLHTNNSPYGGASTVDPFNFVPGGFISPVPTLPGRASELQTTALFAENALDLTKEWKLVAGLRSDRMELDTTDLRTGVNLVKKYSPVTGRLGAVWSPSEALSLYGQFGTGTDPLSGALSLPGGGNTFDLTKGRQVEVGAKGAVPAVRGEWTVALYKIEKRNLLSRDAGNPNLSQQVGQQSSTGIELAFAAEPVRGWTIDANAALLRARYDAFKELVSGALVSRDGNTPTGVPERTASIWTTYRFLPQWQAGFGARYVGARQGNTANTTQLPSYVVLDASLAYDHSRNLKLGLAVKNLADRDYALAGTANARWLLGAPRTVQLTARATF
ncbi:TonB-dependent receptor [Acidovorax sp. A79]|uniref:TonB-dependent receptor n=1 Tax=Acidovorax sp. A79 TaxID=3056107 RepID=UPI0034E87F4C